MHEAGGLLYYDGANLNAILGKVRPGDMGFDVIHMNLHKTFSTPHGGGGPGAGAVGVGERLLPFLPMPIVGRDGDGATAGSTKTDLPQSHRPAVRASWAMPACCCAPTSTCACSAREGMQRVSEFADAQRQLPDGAAARGRVSSWPIPTRRASHEFIVTLKRTRRASTGVTAMDFAKRLLDYGFHAPTTYFPLLVPECLLIEPTETESRRRPRCLRRRRMIEIRDAAYRDAAEVKAAPLTMPVRRLDDVRAAKRPRPDLAEQAGGTPRPPPDDQGVTPVPALICGSIAYDNIMVFQGRFQEHILPDQIHILNVSFLVPDMRREFGGCAGNIAYNLRLLGGEPLIMATVGGDFEPLRALAARAAASSRDSRARGRGRLHRAGLHHHRPRRQPDHRLPSGRDEPLAPERACRRDGGITLGIVAPDGREACSQHAAQFAAAGIPFIFDPGQGLPMFDGEELRHFVGQATWVAVNDYEGAAAAASAPAGRAEEIARRSRR